MAASSIEADHTDGDGAGDALLTGLAAWLPRRFLLAVDVMLDVAFNGAGGPLPAAELGQRRGLETRKLEAILQRLSRANLLRSVRGPNGGYLLGEERGTITLGAIARAVLGQEAPTRLDSVASDSMRKVVLPMIEDVHQVMLTQLDKISLADLCRASRKAGLISKCDGMVDFVI